MAYAWTTQPLAPRFEDMDTDYFNPAVARGANFLDGVLSAPEWRPKVDLATLDLASTDHCVLGQLYGSYPRGLSTLRVASLPTLLGFWVPGAEMGRRFCDLPRAEQAAWAALTESWRRALTPA